MAEICAVKGCHNRLTTDTERSRGTCYTHRAKIGANADFDDDGCCTSTCCGNDDDGCCGNDDDD